MKKTFITLLLITTPFWASSCCTNQSAWVHNAGQTTKVPDNMVMPESLLIDNIRTTDYTAVVHITKGKIIDRGVLRNYERHLYEAEVVETIKGEKHANITFSVMAESGIALNLPTYPIIVSLCSGHGRYYVPDNGYVSGAPKALIEAARKEMLDPHTAK
ncbi:MAG: hypothetical protein U9Q62_04050, partial [Campylobacterota bacterium]|nr:hypothetical protein [Campylobacterota bacterium]